MVYYKCSKNNTQSLAYSVNTKGEMYMTQSRGLDAALNTIGGDSVLEFLKKGASLKVFVPENILEMVTTVKVQNVFPSIATSVYDQDSHYAKAYNFYKQEESEIKNNGGSKEAIEEAHTYTYQYSPKFIYLFGFINLKDGKPVVLHSPKGKDGNKLQALVAQLKKIAPKTGKKGFEITQTGGNQYSIMALDEEDMSAAEADNLAKAIEANATVEASVLDAAVPKHDEEFQIKSLTKQGFDLSKIDVVAEPVVEASETKGSQLDLTDDDLPF